MKTTRRRVSRRPEGQPPGVAEGEGLPRRQDREAERATSGERQGPPRSVPAHQRQGEQYNEGEQRDGPDEVIEQGAHAEQQSRAERRPQAPRHHRMPQRQDAAERESRDRETGSRPRAEREEQCHAAEHRERGEAADVPLREATSDGTPEQGRCQRAEQRAE